jgi:hypothetical protein
MGKRALRMSMKRGTLLLLFGGVCLLAGACDSPVVVQEPTGVVVYSNSFESPSDTVGWMRQGSLEFRQDAPPGGGSQSAYISGGCFAPTASFDISPVDEDRYLRLRCWGKGSIEGGFICLEQSSELFHGICVDITDSVWTSYEAPDTLFCPRNFPLRLSLTSGGIFFNSMLVDRLEIIRIK